MRKTNTKRKRKPVKTKSRPKKRAKIVPFDDPPPIMNARDLAKKYTSIRSGEPVTDDTIRAWAKLAGAPAQVAPGKWRVADFDIFVALMQQMGGPAAVGMHAAEMASRISTTGSVGPAPAPWIGDSEEAQHDTGSSTSTFELLKLTPGDLIKRKTAEEVISRRLANQERKRRLIPRAEIEEWFFGHVQKVLSFKRELVLELPPKLLGLDRPEIESRLREALDELFRRIAELGDPIAAPAGDKPAPAAATAAAPPPDEKSKT